MSSDRPVAVVMYCILFAALLVVGAGYGAYTLTLPSEIAPTLGDWLLALTPGVVLVAAMLGFWFMRWWAVALFWACVLAMSVMMLFVPLPSPGLTFSALAINVAIWITVLAAPPTAIALAYRSRFR
jgi:hypothetical protein